MESQGLGYYFITADFNPLMVVVPMSECCRHGLYFICFEPTALILLDDDSVKGLKSRVTKWIEALPLV